jgi:hypothetical protein
VQGKPQN